MWAAAIWDTNQYENATTELNTQDGVRSLELKEKVAMIDSKANMPIINEKPLAESFI